MNTYTVFCRNSDGQGTTWIDTVEAESLDEAMQVGREMCANAWNCNVGDVHVLGVATGFENVIYWNDQE